MAAHLDFLSKYSEQKTRHELDSDWNLRFDLQCRTVTQIIHRELIEQSAGCCRILLQFEFKINSFYCLNGWTKNPVILDLFNNLKLPNPHSNLPSTFQFLPSRVQINQRKLGVVFKELN